MQIAIDGQEIDFTLETESNAAEVVVSLEKWLASRNAFINRLVIDGEAIDIADTGSLSGRPVPEIGAIEVETESLSGLEMDNALDVVDYLERYLDLAGKKDPQSVSDDGFEGLDWVMTSVRLAAGLNMINLLAYPQAEGSLFQDFVRLETVMSRTRKAADPDTRTELFRTEGCPLLETILEKVRAFYLMIARRRDTSFDPESRADACREELVGLRARLGDLSTDLQTGNELRAMQAIQETTLHLDNLFSFISVIREKHDVDVDTILHEGVTLKAWNERLTEIGNEVIAAFKNEDTILLGDLFEYEIAEELEKAPGFIDAIKDALHARKS